VNSHLVPRSELAPAMREAMLSLLVRYFEGVDRDTFLDDLEEKNWVLLLSHPETGTLLGFSTLLLYEATIESRPSTVVCSGDTIVDPVAWSSMALMPAWIGGVNHLRRVYGCDTLHWLLLVSGYRTYRMLPVFWKEFHPRVDQPIPAVVRHTIQSLAAAHFGDRFDAKRGIVRFARPQVLIPRLRGIPAQRMSNRHVAFFAQANPGHEAGDELVCYTQLNREDLTPAGLRMWQAGESLYPGIRQPG